MENCGGGQSLTTKTKSNQTITRDAYRTIDSVTLTKGLWQVICSAEPLSAANAKWNLRFNGHTVQKDLRATSVMLQIVDIVEVTASSRTFNLDIYAFSSDSNYNSEIKYVKIGD